MIRKNKNYLMVFLIFINIITFLFPSNVVFAVGSDGVDVTTSEISVETDAANITEPGNSVEQDSSGITEDSSLMELDELTTTPSAVEVPVVEPDTVAPVITLIGDAVENVPLWSDYTDLGVTITDNQDIGLVATVTYTKDGTLIDHINTFKEGTYIVHYNVSDAAMNTAVEVTRIVIVGNMAEGILPNNYYVEGYDIDLSFRLLSDKEINDLLEVPNDPEDDDPEVTTPAAVSVRINGTEKVGNTLIGELIMEDGKQVTTSSAVTYEWYRLPSKDSDDHTLIGDNKTYKLVSADGRKYIKLIVSYEGGTFENTTSKIAENSSGTDEDEPPATIPEAVSVRINGTEKVGNTLSGELIMENGNQVSISSDITYEWYRLSSKDSGNGTLVGNNKNYKLVSDDGSKYMKLVVSYEGEKFEAITSKIANNSSSSSSSSSSNNNSNESSSSSSAPNDQTPATNDNSTTSADGWKEDSKDWKYIKNGQVATGWNQIDGYWYLMDSTGTMAIGWQQANSTWYYLKNDGAMATGWQQINGTWYFLKSDGAMATGWQQIDGTWYLLNSYGAMATDL